MQLGMLYRLPLAVARAVLVALRGRLCALCWSLAPLSRPLSLPLSLPLPGWRRVSALSPVSPAGPRQEGDDGDDASLTPTSVNYHFTRQCNYKCGFCFHTAKTSFVLPLEEAKRGLAMLKEAGELGRVMSGRPKWRGKSYPWVCPSSYCCGRVQTASGRNDQQVG